MFVSTLYDEKERKVNNKEKKFHKKRHFFPIKFGLLGKNA